jgi:hypothetical protein
VIAALRELERVEQRVLGALRCVDATTGVPLREPLAWKGDRLTVVRNLGGLYVIREWTPLATHAPAFQSPPPQPSIASLPLELSVRDLSGRYLQRRVQLALPRDPAPEHAMNADSLFRPIDIPMYPSASAPLGANWVALRVTVRETASGDALGGALLRVVSNGSVLARGLTDWRGEALVAVAGVPVTTWSTEPGAVIVTEALNAPDENVRANAALALARAHHPRALEACLATLDDAPSPAHADVTPAVHGLIQIGPSALPALLAKLAEESAMTRLHAQRAVEGITRCQFGFDGLNWPPGAYERWARWWEGAGYGYDTPVERRTQALQRLARMLPT